MTDLMRGIFENGTVGIVGLRGAPLRITATMSAVASGTLSQETAPVDAWLNWHVTNVGAASYSSSITEVLFAVKRDGIAYYLYDISKPVKGLHYALPVSTYIYPGETILVWCGGATAGDSVKYTIIGELFANPVSR